MDKVWTGHVHGDERVIAVDKEYIYKCNPGELPLSNEIIDEQFIHDSKDYFRIPISYITSVRLNENRKYIQILFGKGSEEHFRITELHRRMEIFAYLKENLPGANYSAYTPTFRDISKKPGIAALIILVLYIWTLYYAVQYDNGTEFNYYGHSFFTSLTLGIGSYGVVVTSLVYLSLLLAALLAAIVKSRKRAPVHTLVLKHHTANTDNVLPDW